MTIDRDALTQSTILITGGAGFIGSHLSHHLISQGHCVRIIDDLSTGQRDNLAALLDVDDPKCELIVGRVSDVLKTSPTCLDDVTQIYHLAATVGVRMAVEKPVQTIDNNVDQTRALFHAAAPRNIPVLLASSSEVYGKNLHVPLSEDDDMVLGPSTSPRWSYALSKVFDEHLAWHYHREHGLPIVVVRLFNTIGPRQVGNYGMVVPRFIQQAMSDQPLTLFGDGSQRRCFCDVRDIVPAMVQLLDSETHHGQVYNLGHDQPISIDALADMVIAQTGSRSTKHYVAYEKAYGPGLEDPQERMPNLTRLRKAIDWAPDYTLQATVSDLIAACKKPDPATP